MRTIVLFRCRLCGVLYKFCTLTVAGPLNRALADYKKRERTESVHACQGNSETTVGFSELAGFMSEEEFKKLEEFIARQSTFGEIRT